MVHSSRISLSLSATLSALQLPSSGSRACHLAPICPWHVHFHAVSVTPEYIHKQICTGRIFKLIPTEPNESVLLHYKQWKTNKRMLLTSRDLVKNILHIFTFLLW